MEAAKVGDSILDLRRTVVGIASQQDVVNSHLSNIFAEIRYLRSMGSPDLALRVVELTSMITQLLGHRADIPLLDGVSRVWTLPDTVEYATEKKKVAVRSFLSPRSSDDDKTTGPSRDDQLSIGTSNGWITKRPTENLNVGLLAHDLAKDKRWVEDTNEVLRALQLPQIASDDFEEPGSENIEVGSGDASVADAGRVQDDVDWDSASAGHMPKKSSQLRGIWSKMRFGGSGSPVTCLEIAGSVLAVTAHMVQISSSLSAITSARKAFVRISERLQDLAPFLEQVADLIATGEDSRGGHVILYRTRSLCKEIEQMLYIVASTGISSVVASMRWSLRRATVEGLLEEMESLKLTLSCTLQGHMVKTQIQNHRLLVDSMNRVDQLEESVHMLYNFIQPRADNGK
jgi:hypothetical protein